MAANDELGPEGSESNLKVDEEEFKQMISRLPKEKGWVAEHMYQYQGYWYHLGPFFEGAIHAQQHFNSNPSDILLASLPKSGTTWLKALMFAIINRNKNNNNLLNSNPHECVPLLEFQNNDTSKTNTKAGQPRILSTHMSITSLPASIVSSGCKMVYICRDPKDVLISYWHFIPKIDRTKLLSSPHDKEMRPSITLEEAHELFCKGVFSSGPYWDHVLGYWKASLEEPQRVFFLRYEELKEEPIVYVKKMGQFLECPLTLEEAKEIVELCSFESLSNLKINKEGEFQSNGIVIKNNGFFRQGKVGDWRNHLTSQMAARIDQITRSKFDGSGLSMI